MHNLCFAPARFVVLKNAVLRAVLSVVVFRRQASRNAAKFTEDGRFDDKRAGQLPAFEQA